jgi:hypothetical protein
LLRRNQKNSRIINWICHGQGSELEGSGLFDDEARSENFPAEADDGGEILVPDPVTE